MKRCFILQCLFCLLTITIAKAQSADAYINAIKLKYQTIQANIKSYRIDSMDLPDQSLEGGLATAWYRGRDLKILKAVYYGETGKAEWNYYYDSSKLFFVLRKEYRYNVPMYLDEKAAKENHTEAFDPKKAEVEENRYYFRQDKLLRWLDNNSRQVNMNTAESKAAVSEIISDAYKLRNRMRK